MHTTFFDDFRKANTYDWRLVSPFFRPIELVSKDKDGNPVDLRLLVDWPSLVALNKLRLSWGKPIRLNSAYRTAEHNKQIGGSPKSMHLVGKAFDCAVTDPAFASLARSMGFNAIGYYSTFTHIDTRPDTVTWDNRASR